MRAEDMPSSLESQPVSRYKHVYQKKGDKPWWACVQGEYLGAYANEDRAAQAVGKKLGQPKKSLLRVPQAMASAPKRTHRYV